MIRSATADDNPAIDALLRGAFGGAAEAELVAALHRSGDVRLSLVAEREGQVVGHILFSEVAIASPDGESVPGLALAPLAVHPDWQRQGIGSQLVQEGLLRCRTTDARLVLVLGEPEYYGRFGFTADTAADLESPYAREYFLALALDSADRRTARGRVTYPSPFSDLE